jgi:hypothetical protein
VIREAGQRSNWRKINFNGSDWRADNYGRLGTEFGPFADMSFDAHIKRLENLKQFFKNENGNRIKSILSCEPSWFFVEQKNRC